MNARERIRAVVEYVRAGKGDFHNAADRFGMTLDVVRRACKEAGVGPKLPDARWSPENEALLRRLWLTHSASEIARQLGGFSRNAVIGKAHRLRLQKKTAAR